MRATGGDLDPAAGATSSPPPTRARRAGTMPGGSAQTCRRGGQTSANTDGVHLDRVGVVLGHPERHLLCLPTIQVELGSSTDHPRAFDLDGVRGDDLDFLRLLQRGGYAACVRDGGRDLVCRTVTLAAP